MRFDSRFWWKCRIIFRGCRIAAWSVVLALICVFIWFNQIGLPDFLKKPLVEELRERGIELTFARLRINLFGRLIADNVRLGRVETTNSPTLSLRQVRVELNSRSFWRGHLQVDGLGLREGKFIWPVSKTNGVPRALVIDHIQAELRFQTHDTWSLTHFQADFAGAEFTLSGNIAHAMEIRDWAIFRGRKSTNGIAAQPSLQKFCDVLDRIHFEGTPNLSLFVNGDARDPQSFTLRLVADALSTDTPWARVRRGLLTFQTYPPRVGRAPKAILHFEAGEANTQWGSARNIRLEASISESSNAPPADESWSFWKNLQPYEIRWTTRCTRLQTKKVSADSVACGGSWLAPGLAVTNLNATLGGGQLKAQARLDVATREFSFTNASSFDINAISGFLTEKTRLWLAQFSWRRPPLLEASGSMILPAWTNREPDWRHDVQPTERLKGAFAITNGSFREVAFDSARGHFTYSNLVWELPDLAVTRGATRVELGCTENDATKNYHWHIRGALNPKLFRPLLEVTNAERVLNEFTSAAPAQIDADVWGRLYDYDRIGAHGQIMLTNFSFRGQSADSFQTAFSYTNRVAEFFGPGLWRGPEVLTADRVTVDFNSWRIYFTNGFSTADPEAVARAIGPKVGQALEPYHFIQPPTVHVNGYAPLREITDADLIFNVDGGPFAWFKLRTPRIRGQIHWLGERLILTNVTTAFYGGEATGSAYFDFQPEEGADFQFVANATDVNLHSLAMDLSAPTNQLEGQLSARVVVTHANTTDWRTANGSIQANLRNGLLWEVPIFGILSAPLNTLWPGLGDSRATEASGTLHMTNGVLYSDNLEIRSTMTRLQYVGSVDLKQNVNARVTAQLLHNTWVVGPLISTALWPVSKLFEYQITGTLAKPKSEPLYVPKFLLLPLHPIRSLEEMFPVNAGTNAPSGK
jgi:AsmA-like C-terminal region